MQWSMFNKGFLVGATKTEVTKIPEVFFFACKDVGSNETKKNISIA